MSIVIEYYPAKASKESLRDFLISEGFVKCKYFLSPFPKRSLYYSWFNSNEYKSLDGMEAVIYPLDEKKPNLKWGLYTRSRVWASAYDREKQNLVIKNARKLFGGTFYNDSQGKNIYIKIDKSEYLTSAESGIFQVYERVKSQLSKLKGAIDEYKESDLWNLAEGTHKDIVNQVKENKPSLALYNSLLPFLVSVLEHYFKELFTVLIEFDPIAFPKIKELKLKEIRGFNTIEDVYKIKNESSKIENVIANSFNFQNLEIVNQTFKKYLAVDIKKTLKVRKRIIGKTFLIYDELEEIIQRRHWMIHHFGFSTDLDREKYINYMLIANCAIDLVTLELQKAKKLKIVNHSIYYGLLI